VTFDDHIKHYDPNGFDLAAANAVIASMVARMLIILDVALTTMDFRPLTKWAREYKREIRRLIREATQANRYKLKLAMLTNRAWRFRVMRELGGLPAFMNWHKRQKTGVKLKRQIIPLTKEELARRAHVQKCAKAAANPLIIIDPFKVDFEGEFRLAPLSRFAREGEPVQHNRPQAEYKYDATRKADLRGLNSPISVWPEEFLIFAEIEADILGKAGPKVSLWLKAIAQRAEMQRVDAGIKRGSKKASEKMHHVPP